jgi:hypothetical protein
MIPAINLSPVTTTLVKIIASDNDTGDKFIAGDNEASD